MSTLDFLKNLQATNAKHKYGIRGYQMTWYKCITDAIDGIKPGLISFPAKPNIGKSVFIHTAAVDLAITNPFIRVVDITCDDTKDYITNMMVSRLSDVNRNKADRNLNYDPKAKKAVDDAYKTLQNLATDDRLVILEREDLSVKNITWMDAKDVKNLTEIQVLYHLMKNYQSTKPTIFIIDSPAKIRSQYAGDKIRHNDYIADFFLDTSNELRCPIIVSNEVPKSAARRPTHTDIKSSGNWEYNLKVAFCMSTVDEQCWEKGASPIVMFDCTKNKFSGFKGKLFAILSPSICKFEFRDWSDEERKGFYALMNKSDEYYEKMHGKN